MKYLYFFLLCGIAIGSYSCSESPTTPNKKGAIIDVSHSKIEFGDIIMDVESAPIPFVITNIGDEDLIISKTELLPMGNFFAKSAIPNALQISPGDSFKVDLFFLPDSNISYTATLKLFHNLENSPKEILLEGKGYIHKIVGGVWSIIEIWNTGTVISDRRTFHIDYKTNYQFSNAIWGADGVWELNGNALKITAPLSIYQGNVVNDSIDGTISASNGNSGTFTGTRSWN